MSKKPRVFSREFKLMVVRRMLAGENVTALAREVKVLRKDLYAWRDRFRSGGAEALRQMRLVQPDVRVILMTGYADATEELRVEDLAGFLAKPYEPKQLVETVRRALAS